MISTPSIPGTFRPLYELPISSFLVCWCGHPDSRLLLTEMSMGAPVTEVQIDRPH